MKPSLPRRRGDFHSCSPRCVRLISGKVYLAAPRPGPAAAAAAAVAPIRQCAATCDIPAQLGSANACAGGEKAVAATSSYRSGKPSATRRALADRRQAGGQSERERRERATCTLGQQLLMAAEVDAKRVAAAVHCTATELPRRDSISPAAAAAAARMPPSPLC